MPKRLLFVDDEAFPSSPEQSARPPRCPTLLLLPSPPSKVQVYVPSLNQDLPFPPPAPPRRSPSGT